MSTMYDIIAVYPLEILKLKKLINEAGYDELIAIQNIYIKHTLTKKITHDV